MKKNSAVENFCRHNSAGLNYSNVRYYERCAIAATAKKRSALSICYVLLTSDSLHVTQSKPSSFIHTIPLAQIQDVSLIEDREAWVRGGPNNNSYICQHVRITYDQLSTSKTKTASKGNKPPNKKETRHDDDEQEESSNYSRLSGSLSRHKNLTHIPISIQQDFDPTYNNNKWSSSNQRSPTSSETSIASTSTNIPRPEQRSVMHMIALESETESVQTNETITTAKLSTSSDSPFRSSSVIEQKLKFWRAERNINSIDKSKRPASVDISQLAKLQKFFQRKKSPEMDRKIATTPEEELPSRQKTKSKSQNEKQELNLYFYKPNSVFMNEIHLYWNRQLLNQSTALTEDSSNQQLLSLAKGSNTSNNLHMAKNVFEQLKNDRDTGIQVLFNTKSIRQFLLMGGQGNEHGNESLHKILPVLRLLHRTMLKYESLAYFCLKSPKLLTTLEVVLKSSLIIGKVGKYTEVFNGTDEKTREFNKQYNCEVAHKNHNAGGRSSKKETKLLLEQVSAQIIVLDVFRLLLLNQTTEDNDTASNGGATLLADEYNFSTYAIQQFGTNWQLGSQVLEVTLHSIFAFPCLVEFDFKLKMLSLSDKLEDLDRRDFAKNFELIQLLSIRHNISTFILFDILIFARYSPKDNAKRNVQILINSFNLEPYLRQSTVHLINHFCSVQEILTVAQCTLLHRQFIVLTDLLHISEGANTFLRNEFCEEFRYFINSERLSLKLPYEYAVKEKLSQTCTNLRNLIIH